MSRRYEATLTVSTGILLTAPTQAPVRVLVVGARRVTEVAPTTSNRLR